MSAVVGIDLSTKAIDLVKVDETGNAGHWWACHMEGQKAWDRTLAIPSVMPDSDYWADVYLVAIEAPYGRGQAGTTALLNRVVGAVMASLPTPLREPERCWIVGPHEWKNGLGLKAKPTNEWFFENAPGGFWYVDWPQDAKDAYCLARWARDMNARGIAA